jgi:hypothetical protein
MAEFAAETSEILKPVELSPGSFRFLAKKPKGAVGESEIPVWPGSRDSGNRESRFQVGRGSGELESTPMPGHRGFRGLARGGPRDTEVLGLVAERRMCQRPPSVSARLKCASDVRRPAARPPACGPLHAQDATCQWNPDLALRFRHQHDRAALQFRADLVHESFLRRTPGRLPPVDSVASESPPTHRMLLAGRLERLPAAAASTGTSSSPSQLATELAAPP